MLIRPGIELANLTDVGCHRAENEDYYCYAEPEDDLDFQRKGRLAVVADGMGGHEGGKLASAIAVETVRDGYLNHPDGDPREALQTAFQNAHAAIQEYARQHPELDGMGTTCTGAVDPGRPALLRSCRRQPLVSHSRLQDLADSPGTIPRWSAWFRTG